jgi:CheY-like chemotaxis protein
MKTDIETLLRFSNSAARTHFQPSEKIVEFVQADDVARRPPRSRRQLRVLVADDCRDTANSLATLVKVWGYAAWVAYDGAAALDMATDCQADVLFLDLTMPRFDGYCVARHIRRQARFDESLLIAMTGWADQPHRLLGEAAGFDHYLIKPAVFSTLKGLLASEQDRLNHAATASYALPRALAPVEACQ